MTTEGGEQPITEQDAAALAGKIESWCATLPPAEQALLSMILSRAQATQGAEVEGYYDPRFLSMGTTHTWLTPWALNNSLTFRGVMGADGAFAKDTGPSWVNSPRGMLGGIVRE